MSFMHKRHPKDKAWQKKLRRLSRTHAILMPVLFGLAILIIIAIITTVFFASTLSSKESIMNRNKTGLTLLDRNGKVFYQFYNAHSDTYVALNQITELTQKALIASEDKDFYKHAGFSIGGIVNAIWQNIIPAGNDRGGSTLTQQLVKNSLLSTDRNFLRKYQEIVLSIEVERRYTKAEILEMYLNSAYFGEGAFGIENAAKTYYNKSAKDLDLPEASMLIGLLPAPSAYSPISGNAKFAKERQADVLLRMTQDGYITEEAAKVAKAQELSYAPQNNDKNTKAPHFALMVKEELDKKYGEDAVARSGYTVTTTLNIDWQDKAQGVVGQQVAKLGYAKVSNGSAVIIDPKTGEIEALVGSADWDNTQFGKLNMATATRQAGSSFKPLVYATGIEQKSITAATILHDKLTTFGDYTPYNYDKKFRGDVSVRRALSNSLNVPAIEAIDKIGVQDVMNTAEQLGIKTLTDSAKNYGLPLALGSGQTKLTELTNAYATLANQGVKSDIKTIISIKNKAGTEIFKASAKTTTAISAQTAFIISSILSDNTARAETFGTSLNLWGNRPAAVKTGTTEDYRDALTVGYTPSLAIGVWVGNNDNTPMTSVAGSVGSGPIWKQLMNEILSGKNFEQFAQPAGIVTQTICYGQEAIADNPGDNTFSEFFRASKIPTEHCNQTKRETKKSDTPASTSTGQNGSSKPANSTPVTPTTPTAPTTPATPTTPVTPTNPATPVTPVEPVLPD